MAHTKYSNYSHEELMSVLFDARSKSPIIEELAQRLDAAVGDPASVTQPCPVCEASLTAKFENGQLSLED